MSRFLTVAELVVCAVRVGILGARVASPAVEEKRPSSVRRSLRYAGTHLSFGQRVSSGVKEGRGRAEQRRRRLTLLPRRCGLQIVDTFKLKHGSSSFLAEPSALALERGCEGFRG